MTADPPARPPTAANALKHGLRSKRAPAIGPMPPGGQIRNDLGEGGSTCEITKRTPANRPPTAASPLKHCLRSESSSPGRPTSNIEHRRQSTPRGDISRRSHPVPSPHHHPSPPAFD